MGYKEKRTHGTINFPFEFYEVTSLHRRYNMVHHWHNEHELIRVVSGSILLTIDENEFNAKAGDIVLISEGMIHSGVPTECNYECLLFDMRYLLKENHICNQEINNILSHEKNIQLFFSEDMEDVYQILEGMFKDMRNKNEGYQFKVQGSLYYFLGMVKENNYYKNETMIDTKNKRRLYQLKNVLSYIELNYSSYITLGDLSECANMNSRYFCKFFKAITHKTPIEYLNYYRIECACEQMSMAEKNITEIAFDCGFNDLSYFIKVFKKIKYKTPYQFLKRNCN